MALTTESCLIRSAAEWQEYPLSHEYRSIHRSVVPRGETLLFGEQMRTNTLVWVVISANTYLTHPRFYDIL